MVISPAKLEANRRNATKSTGPRSPRGKAIVSKNATKHGLLSQNPPLLAKEDLETFQGLVQSLVDDYQPQTPVEWHLLQTIAMCIQRQHRLWQAEASILNEQMLPVIPRPDIDEKYPWKIEREDKDNDEWSCYHPTNLKRERRILEWALEHLQPEDVPNKRKMRKYWDNIWTDWKNCTLERLEYILTCYPHKGFPEYPSETSLLVSEVYKSSKSRYVWWMRNLSKQGHPYPLFVYFKSSLESNNGSLVNHYRENIEEICNSCQERILEIEKIEQERFQAQQQYEQQLQQRRELTAMRLPEKIHLLGAYETRINRQLYEAIDRLEMLRSQRNE
ncbi:MAG: hypothetical protein MUD14_00145 [Hydrococcus sp. Prado102]|jgi:hypothetical protein|nr:hypothetical protein [Hydrococcus sp. Prado102]